MSDDLQSRRLFLKDTFKTLITGGLLANSVEQALADSVDFVKLAESSNTKPCPPLKQAESSLGKLNYRINPWTGDISHNGHDLREGIVPKLPDEAERSVDFVIVGGGLSGLSAAYFLRDENFVLLEQYDTLGGQSRSGSYRDLSYSFGPSYVSSMDSKYQELYRDLGIKPVMLPTEKNNYLVDGKWLSGKNSKTGGSIYNALKQLRQDCEPIWNKVKVSPLPHMSEDLSKLDQALFQEVLQKYDSKFLALLNSYCLSRYCGSIDQISALAGYLLMANLYEPSYVFEGGNSAITKALVKKLNANGAGRLESNCFVWDIALKENSASVAYSTKDGTTHRINCRHVIITAPPLVAARFVKGMPDNLRAQLLSCKFGSYLVANLGFKKDVLRGAYDNIVETPVDSAKRNFVFTDFVTANTAYKLKGNYKPAMGSVLTIYQPYPPGSIGRP
ncbi:MAG: FAD-dependent oxidoreductase, partial [Gammaproteobacteria bacterium]|nr:FAD-dependent oxidoreductase [Gammaproteobacteria bacterium]